MNADNRDTVSCDSFSTLCLVLHYLILFGSKSVTPRKLPLPPRDRLVHYEAG